MGSEKTKLRGLLEILSNATEYRALHQREEPSHMPVYLLLQAHFERRETLSSESRADQKQILRSALKLLQALVDVISSNGWLKPALAAMELSQMIVQGLWNRDHPLLQIPHFTEEVVARCSSADDDVETVFDILALEEGRRAELLQLASHQMVDVAAFCNDFPNVDLTYEIVDADDIACGEPVSVNVVLERDADQDEGQQVGRVFAPRYPAEKLEAWWLIVAIDNVLLSIKRLSLAARAKARLDFVAPDDPGTHTC